MSTPVNHFKLGLFVIVGFAVAIVTAVLFGGALARREMIRYHSYFNESVQGLDLGSPVKFRGVTIGHVSSIEIAPDHRMVDVVSELDAKEIKRMGLAEAGASRGVERFAIPPDLRTQLGSQGVTGVKYVAIDFFDVQSNPPPKLPFNVPKNEYIPAAPSMMKNLEDTISQAMERLPEMVDAVVMIMRRIDGLFETLERQDVSGKAVESLSQANAVMATLQGTLTRLDRRDLGAKVADTLADVNVTLTKMNGVLDEVNGKGGLIASAQQATEALGEVGRTGQGTQKELETTLRAVGDAAEAIRALVNELERDPDMLLKGKAERGKAQ
jgi:phospholipid/cholesterol/gamma-HCH transport system substrate-binding protein